MTTLITRAGKNGSSQPENMDALLERVGVQAINYAVRSGIAITSGFAVQQCARLLKTVDDKLVRVELVALQELLNTKIKVCGHTMSEQYMSFSDRFS